MSGEKNPNLTLGRLFTEPGLLVEAVAQMFPSEDDGNSLGTSFRIEAINSEVFELVRQPPTFLDPAIQNYQIGDGSHAALQRFIFSTLQITGRLDNREDWQNPSRFQEMALELLYVVVRELYFSAVNAVKECWLQEVRNLAEDQFLQLLSDHPWLSTERLRPKVTLEPVASTDVPNLAEIVGGEGFASMMSSLLQRAPMGTGGRS